MSESAILHIRQSIALAREHEKESQQLQKFLRARLPSLHPSIALPQDNAVQALLEFVERYIEHVPDFLEALQEFMREANIYDYGKTFIAIAEDFFLQPPELVREHFGLQALIDEAYLAHRLVEEINDRLELSCGTLLAPMDMTLSNIIVHDILGEEFANQLDLAVHYAVEALFAQDDLANQAQCSNWLADQHANRWREALKRWPSLAGDNSIRINLREPARDDLAALDDIFSEAQSADKIHTTPFH